MTGVQTCALPISSGWLLTLPRAVRQFGASLAARAGSRRLQRAADVLLADDDDPYGAFISWCTKQQVTDFTGAEAPRAPLYAEMVTRSQDLPPHARSGLLDLVSYLPDDILTKVDRASMAVGLEVRCPLLDHRVVEFALGLPHVMKWNAGRSKWLLRRLLNKRVPEALTDQIGRAHV